MKAILKIKVRFLIGMSWLVSMFIFFFFLEAITSSRILSHSNEIIRTWSNQTKRQNNNIIKELYLTTYKRVLTYERLLTSRNLSRGMVVNSTASGKIVHQCDSLLFSSLRFIALSKIGLENSAQQAWKSIATNSNRDGRWIRHPLCSHRSTSRDMVLGLLSALSQNPPGSKRIITQLIETISDKNGYFDNGPFYVSFIGPQLGNILRTYKKIYKVESNKKINLIDVGFSTLAFNSITSQRGYTSHLLGLNSWLELELKKNHSTIPLVHPYGFFSALENISRPLGDISTFNYRLPITTFRLSDLDQKNLFFVWLRLQASGLIDNNHKVRLLSKLISMPQFPHDRLPQNCDRKADYLWQRDSIEYRSYTKDCTIIFSGVDFTWMAALLLEENDNLSAHN